MDVFYEVGRYGYWLSHRLIAIGANVQILPINKQKVLMNNKTIITNKLDTRFLGGLYPSDHVPNVYILTLKEDGHRDAEQKLERIKTLIDHVNAQMIALTERTPLLSPDF